jgi:hypothetical protein
MKLGKRSKLTDVTTVRSAPSTYRDQILWTDMYQAVPGSVDIRINSSEIETTSGRTKASHLGCRVR